MRGAELNPLATLGLGMGSAWLSGFNLYATVLTLGLLQCFHLVQLPGDLDFISRGWVVAVAAILYLVEFLADKIRWWTPSGMRFTLLSACPQGLYWLRRLSPIFTRLFASLPYSRGYACARLSWDQGLRPHDCKRESRNRFRISS